MHDRIRLERERAGIPIAQCARAVGWPPAWWSEMEAGSRPLYADHMAVIAKILGVTVARLYGEQKLLVPALRRRGRRRLCRACRRPVPCPCGQTALVAAAPDPHPILP